MSVIDSNIKYLEEEKVEYKDAENNKFIFYIKYIMKSKCTLTTCLIQTKYKIINGKYSFNVKRDVMCSDEIRRFLEEGKFKIRTTDDVHFRDEEESENKLYIEMLSGRISRYIYPMCKIMDKLVENKPAEEGSSMDEFNI